MLEDESSEEEVLVVEESLKKGKSGRKLDPFAGASIRCSVGGS